MRFKLHSITALLLSVGAKGNIDSAIRYLVTAEYINPSGVSEPLQDKEMAFTEVSASARGSHLVHNSKDTDKNGVATLISGDYATFIKRSDFCAKLSGSWYCASVPEAAAFNTPAVTSSAEPMIAHNFLNFPVSKTPYTCTMEINQSDLAGKVHVFCRDRM